MDTRLLYTIALIFVTVVGGFYYFSGKSKRLENAGNQNLNSTAENIHITQTNDYGQLYAKATAEHLTQWMQDGKAEIDQIQGILFENGRQNATFHADKSIATNNYQDIELIGNVMLSKFANKDMPSIRFNTEQLYGNTKTNQIKTDHMVNVTSPQATFKSQGLTGNLTTGQYEFFNIRGMYDPASP